MKINSFIAKYRPKFKAEVVDTRPGGLLSNHIGMRHYLCSFTTTRGQFVTFYSAGSAYKTAPILADVLQCLVSDAQLGDMTYNEACREYDMVDYRMWNACRVVRDDIIDTFGRKGFSDLLSLEF